LAWALLYKHNFSPQRCYIWNNFNIVYKNKSLFYDNWFNNGILLVSQLFNKNGLLFSYSEFLAKYKSPVSPREFSIVFDAVPSGLWMLFRSCDISSLTNKKCPFPCSLHGYYLIPQLNLTDFYMQ